MESEAFQVKVHDASAQLADSVAEAWVRLVDQDSQGSGFHVALSGGRIAVPFLKKSAELFAAAEESRKRLKVFWADDRCVPPDHADSNYRMFQECFAPSSGIEASQVFRFEGEANPPEAASALAATLKQELPLNEAGVPVFDLILLGMGEDGHVASLFPENMTEDLQQEQWVFDVIASKPPPQRLTLSYEILKAARHVWVMISGAGKEKALMDSLRCQGDTPLAQVLQQRDRTEIFTDFDLPA